MAEGKKQVYRLFKVAKELNVGSATLVEHLESKGFEVNNSPNEKLNEEMYGILLRDFASEKVLKEKADQIKEQKREGKPRSEDQPGEEDKFISAADLKSGALEEEEASAESQTKTPAEKEEKKVAETPVEEKKEAPAKEEPVEEDKGGLKVKGKIDLSQFDRKKSPKKQEPKAEEKPVAKEPEKKVEEEKPVQEEKPVEKKPEPKEEKVAAKKEAVPEEKKEETKTEEESPEQEVIRASSSAPRLSGLTIKGKIELPVDKRRAGRKEETTTTDDGDGTKRKRKRKRRRTTAVSSNDVKKGGNRGEKRKKEEPSEKEIQEIIKSTLADMNKKSGRSRQRMRRAKRDEDAQRREKELLKKMEESMVLEVTEFITANELANMMSVPVTEIITKCMELGLFVSINQRLEADVISLLAEEYNYGVKFVDIADQDFEAEEDEDDPESLEPRAPIITVMGHVDHGKTALLDYIRKTNVVSGEAGGITQHIGAYEVIKDGKNITFLDTPGHEAFTAMRARGAKLTDLAIIVIAADDAVMPQTKEAINHAEAAGVPMVFAINKIDKDNSNPERIREQLANMNYLVEDWGGKFQCQEISAKKGVGIEELLEKVLLEAEMLELKANPNKPAKGTVVEARLDKGRGVVATVLVQEGTLRIGDAMVAGTHFGKMRAMTDERGEEVQEAGPSTPVRILGLAGVPQAGDRFVVYEEERRAKEAAQKRAELERQQKMRQRTTITLDEIARRKALGDFKELNLIVKGDVDGSVEALSDSLLKLSEEEVQVNVIMKGVGQITENDVNLASASDAVIIGFQVRPSAHARKMAETEGVDIRTYSIIYDAINDVQDALSGMLSPEIKEEILGTAEIRDIFKITKVGTVAGCMVTHGKITRNDPVRLIRDGIVIYEGKLSSLKRFKEDAKEVQSGYDCGLTIDGYNDIKVGDNVESYRETEVARSL